ncbi:MAG: metallophosphoesterase [Nanoarchaeota archaeon]|nr:metallophosphoesterase [Nanoarchaeota archaeon]
MATPTIDIRGGIRLIGTAAYIKPRKTLVFSDFHIGYEQALLSKGILIPKTHFSQLLSDAKQILQATKPEMVIVTGDVKHDFGGISEQEWREASRLINLLKQGRELVLIQGNHDNILKPIADKKDLALHDSYHLGDFLFLHGDKQMRVPKEVKTVIMGHEHPALDLKSPVRTERYKCFISARWRSRQLIVLPSSNPLFEGTDVRQGCLGPILPKAAIREYFVLGDRFYRFPASAIDNFIF